MPNLRQSPPVGQQPRVGWLVGESNYTHLYYIDGRHRLVCITLYKVCQRYPHLVRLTKQLAVDPTLIVDWHSPARKRLMVTLEQAGQWRTVAVSRRRINQVLHALSVAKSPEETG